MNPGSRWNNGFRRKENRAMKIKSKPLCIRIMPCLGNVMTSEAKPAIYSF